MIFSIFGGVIMFDELVNAASSTIAMVCGQTLEVKRGYVHHRNKIENSVAVVLEFVGDIDGRVVIRFTDENAKKTASAMMCGMPVEQLDEMALSALSELGNMIMGGAATNYSEEGKSVDITTPKLVSGAVDIMSGGSYKVSIPLENAEMRVVLDISLRESRRVTCQ